MTTVKAKYYDIPNKQWKTIEATIDKKLHFDYAHCTWFAIDGEFMGLYPQRDKTVIWTIVSEDEQGDLRCEMLYTYQGDADLTTLRQLLESDKEMLLYYGLSDLAFLYTLTGVKRMDHIYDIRIASTVARTYTSEHSIDSLVKMFSGSDDDIIKKKELGSLREWVFDPAEWDPKIHQYNINDVIYLKFLSEKMKEIARLGGREEEAQAAIGALPHLAILHAKGFYRNIFNFGYDDRQITSGTVLPYRS